MNDDNEVSYVHIHCSKSLASGDDDDNEDDEGAQLFSDMVLSFCPAFALPATPLCTDDDN